MNWVLLLNLVNGSFLLGLVAFVHVVHYPLFRQVDASAWHRYHLQHTRRTSWLVAPAMLIDALAAGMWALHQNTLSSWIALACVAIAWGITFVGAVPAHNRLAERFDETLHRRLMRFNLARLVAWTARIVLIVAG
jgi:hypothetical protein